MAGDWIKMQKELDTTPEVVRISSAIKADRFSVVGRLFRIWSWADSHSIDGKSVSVSAAFLDDLIGTPGFAAAMRDAGWLSGRDGSLQFPNFERHNGDSAKRRAQDVDRKRVSRASEKCPPSERTKSGPEKRREEKSNTPIVPKGTLDSLFRKFWLVVHRKEGRKNSKSKFEKAVKEISRERSITIASAGEWLVSRMEAFSKSDNAKHEIRGKLLPATWLHQGRYDDDDEVWSEGSQELGCQFLSTEEMNAGIPDHVFQRRRDNV